MKTVADLNNKLIKLREQYTQYARQLKFSQWNMSVVIQRQDEILKQIEKLKKEDNK